MYQEKREEVDLPASKTLLTHPYNGYIEKHERGLITAIRNNTDNTIDNRRQKLGDKKWKEKQLHRRFKLLINNISYDKTRT